MARRSPGRHLLLAVVVCGWTASAAAQEVGAPSEETAPPSADDSSSTLAETDEPEADDAEDAPSPLVPSWEPARMAERPVTENIRYVPGTGLEIESADRAFSMQIRLRLQAYGEVAWDDGAEPELQFHVRRARLVFGGHMFDEDIVYRLQLAFAPRDMGMTDNFVDPNPRFSPLRDFYVDFRQLRDLEVRIGQTKVPFSRQRLISSGNLQMVDRSSVNAEFNLDRDVGIQLRSSDLFGLGALKYALGAFMARGRDSLGFDDFGLLWVARLEVLPFGMFEDTEEADFERSLRPRLGIGAAYAYLDRAQFVRGTRGPRPTDEGTTDMQLVTADAMFKIAGFSLQSELTYRNGVREAGPLAPPVEPPRDGIGFMAQAGFLLPRLPLEPSARYSLIRGIGTEGVDTSLSDSNELGIGFSVYLAQHALKLQSDYLRGWSDEFGTGEHHVRVQVQASL